MLNRPASRMTMLRDGDRGREEREAASARLEELWQQSFDEDNDDEMDEEEASTFLEPSDEGAGGPIPMLEAGPREGQREVVQARALLEKAERLHDKASPEDQKELDRLMQNIRISMEDRNWNGLETACNSLADVMFYLEDA